MSDEYLPKIAMTIQAHPDDQEFSVGGTLAKWAKTGCEIISVVITSGDSGSNDPAKDGNHKKELADLREQADGMKAHWQNEKEAIDGILRHSLAAKGGPQSGPVPTTPVVPQQSPNRGLTPKEWDALYLK